MTEVGVVFDAGAHGQHQVPALGHILPVLLLQRRIGQILQWGDQQFVFRKVCLVAEKIHRHIRLVQSRVVLHHLPQVGELGVLGLNLQGIILVVGIDDPHLSRGGNALHFFHVGAQFGKELLQFLIGPAGLAAVGQDAVPVLFRAKQTASPTKIHHRVCSMGH